MWYGVKFKWKSFQIKSFVQGAAFGSTKDLSMQLAMDAMDQLYGHKGGNLNVLEKWLWFENIKCLNKCYKNKRLLCSTW